MNKTPTRNYVIEIPLHWTAAQADAVFDFICTLETAVFDAYDQEISEIAHHQDLAARIDTLHRDDDEDPCTSDIPF